MFSEECTKLSVSLILSEQFIKNRQHSETSGIGALIETIISNF